MWTVPPITSYAIRYNPEFLVEFLFSLSCFKREKGPWSCVGREERKVWKELEDGKECDRKNKDFKMPHRCTPSLGSVDLHGAVNMANSFRFLSPLWEHLPVCILPLLDVFSASKYILLWACDLFYDCDTEVWRPQGTRDNLKGFIKMYHCWQFSAG